MEDEKTHQLFNFYANNKIIIHFSLSKFFFLILGLFLGVVPFFVGLVPILLGLFVRDFSSNF